MSRKRKLPDFIPTDSNARISVKQPAASYGKEPSAPTLMRTDIIIIGEWVECLARLRDARTLILRDAEAFHEACTALERIGQILCGKLHHGLSKYQAVLLDLANLTGRHDPAEVDRLFNGVREARNMAVHEGAWARHLSTASLTCF